MQKRFFYITVLLLLLSGWALLQAQEQGKVLRHIVKPKETLMSIARQYKVTPYKLIKYNPGISDVIHPGDTIIIPVDKNPLPDSLETSRRYAGFRYHTVKENETVFSIAKQYNTTIEDIIKVNHIEANNIKLGQIIIIPILPDPHRQIDTTRYTYYTVKPKEGKWRVAYDHGISVDELERLNPQIAGRPLQVNEELVVPKNRAVAAKKYEEGYIYHQVKPLETLYGLSKKYNVPQEEIIRANPSLADGLKAGQLIRIPVKRKSPAQESPSGRFMYYTVKPHETVYSLTKKFNISTADLLKYNPQLAEGLKAGQVLRLPRPEVEVVFDADAPFFIKIVRRPKPVEYTVDLAKNGDRLRTYRMAVLLPFRMERFADSTGSRRCAKIIKDKVTNYYAGIQMALDSLQALGFRVRADFFDTRGDGAVTERILLDNDLSDYDFVLGPIYKTNVARVQKALAPFNTPVVVPSFRGEAYPNLVRTVSDSAALARHMLAYLNETVLDEHYLIIYDHDARTTADSVAVSLGTLNKWQVHKSRRGSWARKDDIARQLAVSKPNRVVIVTKDQSLLANLISALDGLSAQYRIQTYLITPVTALDKFDIKQMAAIDLHFPSRSRLKADPRVSQYLHQKYGLRDNSTIYNGFDTTMDLILRLANADNLFDGLKRFGKTEESQRIYLYDFKENNGFSNIASYILHINKQLEAEKVD